ncbi:MAG: Uma2 family endonuclease [Gemmatimonadales bacterium]
MPELAHHWTRAEVLALPDDGKRYELVDGDLLVSPSPRPAHQRAVFALAGRLMPYVVAHRLGECFYLPADLDLDADHLVQPDLFVIPSRSGGPVREWTEAGIPLLTVEVISPSTARYDRIIKRRRYQRSGVPTYWIIDLDARLAEVWTPDAERPQVVEDILTWQPGTEAPPLRIDLPAVFNEADGPSNAQVYPTGH